MGETTIGIRQANIYDIFALEYLLAKGIDESKGLLPPYHQQHMFEVIGKLIYGQLVVVAVEIDTEAKREKVIGTLILEVRTWSHNPDVRFLESLHYYVLPEYRSRRLPDEHYVYEGLAEAGKLIADVAAQAGIATGLRLESIHVLGDKPRAVVKDVMFEKLGLAYSGGNFFYLPKAPEATEKAA